MDDMEEFDFPLTKPVPYAAAGSEEIGTFIKLSAPSSKQLTHCAHLKQAFVRAVTEQVKNNPDAQEGGSDKKIKGEDIIYLLYGSESADMGKILLSAIELFASGVAQIEGEVKLTKPIIGAMSNDDLEGMLGEYMANFILRSVLNKTT